jgi:nicotinamidase-related amidase
MARSQKKTPAPSPESAAPGAALLAVDLQGSLLAALPAPARRSVLSRAALALAAAEALHIPVVFSEQAPAKLGPTAPALRKFAPAAPVFAKTTFSALADEPLLASLREQQIEHLLLVGLETPICIYQTALGALAEGFQVTVLSDAVSARRPDDHAATLAALRHAGIHVLPVETVLYALLHDAGHPLFKTITTLVKTHA